MNKADRYLDPPRHGRQYRFRRRVPADVAPFLDRIGKLPKNGHLAVSLKTRDLAEARRRRDLIEAEQDLWFAELMRGETDATVRYQRALLIARRARIDYRPASELADDRRTSSAELARRLDMVLAASNRSEAALGILGGAERPQLSVRGVLGYWREKIAERERQGKSPAQFRRFITTREQAVEKLIGAVGDIPWADLTRERALAFRDDLAKRIAAGEIKAETGDRQIAYVQGLWSAYAKETGDEGLNPFRALRLTGRHHVPARRESIPPEIMRNWLELDAFGRLNAEARDILLGMVNTGARLGEIGGLAADDIRLEDEVPHILIRDNEHRAIKSKSSKRAVPLVGISLEAIGRHARGFPRYAERVTQLSAILNKTLRERRLMPEHLKVYGVRHAWKDRAIAAGADPELREVLMGHAVGHVVYGVQGSLRDRLQVMELASLERALQVEA
jgi:integrase